MSQQINLVNPLLLRKRYAFGLREMALGVVVAAVLALGWAGVLTHRAGALEARAAQKEAQQASAHQTLEALQAAAARPASALLTERLKTLQAEAGQRDAVLAALDGTLKATSIGFAARMRALAYGRVDGVWLNRFTLSPDHVALEGSALDAALLPAYMDALGHQTPLSGLRFSGMNVQPAQDAAHKDAAAPSVDFTLYSGKREESARGANHGA